MTIEVRPARRGDLEEICKLHTLSIERLGPLSYPTEIVREWARGLHPAGYQQAMDSGEDMFVAEVSGKLVGFAAIVLIDREIRAIYVHPEHTRTGIGTALLECLEEFARDAGVNSLKLNSSLGAVSFYEACGYEPGERFFHRLQRSGLDIECIRMSKILSSSMKG